METLRLTLRRVLTGGFVLIVAFVVLAILWLIAISLGIIPHGD